MNSLHVLFKNDKTVVQFSPNTFLSEILKKACTQLKLKDHSIYGLTHSQKPVNLSLPFRLSGIPNSSRVTIVENNTSKGVLELRIAIQLADGTRLQSSFKTTCTLWDILLHFERQNPALNLLKKTDPATSHYLLPTMIILNKEYDRIEELQKSTLKMLMISESIVMNFKHKPSGQSYESLKDLVEGYQPPVITSPPVVSPTASVATPPTPTTIVSPITPVATPPTPTTSVETPPTPTPTNVVSPPTQNPTVTTTSPQPIPVVVSPPIKTTEAFASPQPVHNPIPTPNNTPVQSYDRRFEDKEMSDVNPGFFEKATQILQQFSSSTYEEFMEKKRPQKKLPEPEPQAPSDRKLAIYIPVEEDLDPSTIQFDESFTAEDFKRLTEANKRIKQEKEHFESILRTKEMRDNYLEQKTRKFVDTSIRLIFPDRRVLEMKFLTKEKVQRLYDYLVSLLDEPIANFYLYVSPPKKELDLTMTFKKSELFPAANVYVGLRKNVPAIKFNSVVETMFTTAYESANKELPKKKSPVIEHITVAEEPKATTTTTSTSTSNAVQTFEPTDEAPMEFDENENKPEPQQKTKTLPKWFQKGKQ